MDDSRLNHLIRLRDINQTRLNELEVQKARLGINCPPEIQTEIEEIKKVVQRLDGDINNEPRTAGNVLERFKIFISSSVKDKELTDIISHTISRITLGQIETISFKSGTTSGEITPFNVWFDEMRARSNQIRTLVILLTPASIMESSIYFQSGIIASRSDCSIMPVCIGIDCSREVPFPLSMYQRYQLSDYASFENFAKNLLHLYNITFDQEMVEPVLKRAITKVVEISSIDQDTIGERKSPDALELLESVRQHIDRRFLELFEIQTRAQLSDDGDLKKVAAEQIASYTVPIYLNIGDLQGKQFLEITPEMLIQDVYDSIYFMIRDKVEAFTYLQKWILRERKTGIYLIMREVSVLVPAKILFNSKYEWEAAELDKPYSPSDANMNRRMWVLALDLGPRPMI